MPSAEKCKLGKELFGLNNEQIRDNPSFCSLMKESCYNLGQAVSKCSTGKKNVNAFARQLTNFKETIKSSSNPEYNPVYNID